MSKSSRAIALVLIPFGMMFLGFWANSCDEEEGYSTTQSSSGSGYHHSFWRSSGSRGSSYSSGSSSHSGTSRGGFGSTGHSSS